MSLTTSPYSGVGFTLGYKVGASTVYTPLILLRDDAAFSEQTNNTIEIKTLSSGVVTKIPGRTDSGTFTGSCYNVDGDAGVAELWTLFQNKSIVAWQVQAPDGTVAGTTYQFSAFVGTLTPNNFTGEDAPVLEFELPISGLITKSVGS